MSGPSSDGGSPVAIGGVGGSGTRVGASLLQILGFYIGGDVNEALDNLWFTLLFKHRSILASATADFERLARIFWSRMTHEGELTDEDRLRVRGLAARDRIQHPAAWLEDRVTTLLAPQAPRTRDRWGWKEPNTHLVIERLFDFDPQLRYVHFVRHPVDMALSGNQNQLENWGPILLNRDVSVTPASSLAYWCAAHRRAVAFMERHPARTMMIDFDAVCMAPAEHGAAIAAFLNADFPPEACAKFQEMVEAGRPADSRHRLADPSQFDPADLAYVAELGYEIPSWRARA